MAVTRWLIDKSALVRLGASREAEQWANRIERGQVRIATITLLEVGYSARTATDLEAAFATPTLSMMPVEHLTPAIEERAVALQSLLPVRGHHRGPSLPDILIAAAAETGRAHGAAHGQGF